MINEVRHPGIELLNTLVEWNSRGHFTLEPATARAAQLGNPQDKVRSIHVAGTNGKGTVCSYLAAMLVAAGYRVGQYASPHLTDVTERCLLDGRPVAEERLGDALLRVSKLSEEQLSYFELLTLASFLVFSESDLDWIVVEVGLGGRLDATNTLTRPDAAVITTIDFDHTNVLGNTLREIGREKAGIFKRGTPAYVGDVSEEAFLAIHEHSQVVKNEIEFWGRDFHFDSEKNIITSRQGQFVLPEGMRGAANYQRWNAALAARVGQTLSLTNEAIAKGLHSARWPGRVEHLFRKEGGSFLLDVAHNPQGMAALVGHLRGYLQEHREITQVIFLVAALDRKDWRAMLDELVELEDDLQIEGGVSVRWLFSTSEDEHSVPPREFVSYLHRGEAIDSAASSFERAEEFLTRNPNTLTVVTGSIYFVGKLRPLVLSATGAEKDYRTIL